VRFVVDGPATLRSVALAGTFNSWVGDACMLERVTPTRWTCTLPLSPGRHLYKFVLDDTHWIADPANPWLSEDGQGNSCLTVCPDGTVFLRRRGLRADAPGCRPACSTRRACRCTRAAGTRTAAASMRTAASSRRCAEPTGPDSQARLQELPTRRALIAAPARPTMAARPDT
jgi:hypothetical protein